MKLLLLITVCLVTGVIGCTNIDADSPLFVAVAKYHYAANLNKEGLIARLSIGGKNPSTHFLRAVNAGIVGRFYPMDDYEAARNANNYRELNFGEVEPCSNGWYVYATEGVFPPAHTFLRFLVKREKSAYIVVSGGTLNGIDE